MTLSLKRIKKYLQLFALIVILSLGIFFRTYHLSTNPLGFFCDEAAFGYNAYTILTTGKDEFGNTLPIFFKSFGEYKDPLQVYSTVPFVAAFGLNEFATRIPSAIYGCLTILILFFLGKQLKGNSLGITASLIAATMPWLIHYSRVGFELALYTAFFTTTIYLFLKAVAKKSYLTPAFVIASLTLYTYQPAKLLIILLVFGLLFIYRKTYFKYKQEVSYGLLYFFLLSLPMILSIFNGEFIARFSTISVFSAHLSLIKTILLFVHNYFLQLSPSYLIAGEPTGITRHFTHGLAPLLIITMPFLLIGIAYVLLNLKNKSSQVLFYWLLLYPVAGAVTAEAPFTGRSIIGAPLFAIFIGYGILVSYTLLRKGILKYLILVLFVLIFFNNLAAFTQFYFYKYPVYSANYLGWQYGPRDIMHYFASHQGVYHEEFLEPDEFNAPSIFLKFYAPKGCHACKLGTPRKNYHAKEKQLFAVSPSYMNAHTEFFYKTIKQFYYPNGYIAYSLVEVTLKQK